MLYRSLTFLLISISTASFAQTQQMTEPQFKWKIYYLQENQTLAPLEALPYAKRMKSGLSKNKSLIEVKGAKSGLRLKGALVFAVKVADNQLDPDQMLTLYKMETDSKHRFAQLKSVGAISKRTELSNGELLKFARYGDNCLLMTNDESLPPGEYGFFLPFSPQLFLFGID